MNLKLIATKISAKPIIFVNWEDYHSLWLTLQDLDILNNIFGKSKFYYMEDPNFFSFLLSKDIITHQDLINNGRHLDFGHFKKFNVFDNEYFDKYITKEIYADFDSFADYVLTLMNTCNWNDESIKNELINHWKLNKKNMSLEEHNSLLDIQKIMES